MSLQEVREINRIR